MTIQPPQACSTFDDLPDHRGQPRKVTSIFFVDPPTTIGLLRSAESTLGNISPGKFLAKRIGVGIVFALLLIIPSAFIGSSENQWHINTFYIGLGAGLLVGAIAFLSTRFKATCSYVGQLGIASYSIKSRRKPKPVASVFLFENAAQLRAMQTRHYTNGIYNGTTYNFAWHGPRDNRLHVLKGRFNEGRKGIKVGDPFHYVRAAELAWSVFYLDRAAQQLADEGSIPFNVGGNRALRVGPGFIEFHFDKIPVRLAKEEIESINLSNGQFSFKHKDAKWYSRAGKYSFSYASMANARVFLLSLDRLMGYRWS